MSGCIWEYILSWFVKFYVSVWCFSYSHNFGKIIASGTEIIHCFDASEIREWTRSHFGTSSGSFWWRVIDDVDFALAQWAMNHPIWRSILVNHSYDQLNTMSTLCAVVFSFTVLDHVNSLGVSYNRVLYSYANILTKLVDSHKSEFYISSWICCYFDCYHLFTAAVLNLIERCIYSKILV